MIRQLGGITLPGMTMQESGHSLGRKTVLRQTLDGTPLVFSGTCPRRITLVAGDDYGIIDAPTLAALLALAASNDTTDLVWGDDNYSVAFDHEANPAILLAPLWPGAAYYNGSITLIVI